MCLKHERVCLSTSQDKHSAISGDASLDIAARQFITRQMSRGWDSGRVSSMTTSLPSANQHKWPAYKTILFAGLVAGILDGLDAVVYIGLISGIPVHRIFQFIASGLLGISSFRGGTATVALGVLLHFVIATGAAATFYALSTKLRWMLQQPLLWGPVFGIGVFLFMHYLVVPLSAAPKQPPTQPGALINLIFSHVFFVGIPIAFITRRGNHVA